MKERNKILNGINKNSISADDLADYLLFKNGLEPENPNFAEKIEAIEDRLRVDEAFAEEFRLMSSEMSDLDNFILGISPAGKPVESATAQREISNFSSRYKYAFASVIAVFLIYIGLLFVSDISKPAYFEYASLEESPEFYTTRGRETDDFQNSLKALDDGNYSTAIVHLEADIRNNPGDETIFYTHYVLGLSYLETSKKSFIGLFPSYDKQNAEKAVHNLMLAAEKNNSGKFHNVTLDAYYFAAKGYLMMDDKESAKKYLQKVVDERGSREQEALSILTSLE